ncbi:hypothetical protein FGO68_gene10830 [Halteria grandinella]|uniref:Uncharacterized protein n=1 Tax=Halteria grandinella TaxID=5974 RepID=A0A8J8N952_HALGN|nr:hypothetical protein FGO68_gene10830 [Halteria grandinella]
MREIPDFGDKGLRVHGLEMPNFQRPAPLVIQILNDKASVTIVRCSFRAQQAPTLQLIRSDLLFDTPVAHEIQETAFIGSPLTLLFLEFFQHIAGWGKKRRMHVFDSTDSSEKVRQIIGLRKAGKLRCIVETYVYQFLNASILQAIKESLSCCLCKAN